MFLPPQCSLGGEVPSLGINSFSSLHCDPRGAVWAVDGSGTRVFCFSGTIISEMMSSSVMTTSVEPFTPIFECNEGDRILSIVFPTIGGGQQVFVCIATINGCLILCDADSPELVLHQCELESQITAVTAVPISDGSKTQNQNITEVAAPLSTLVKEDIANGASVLVSFFDETFSEVVLVEWGGDDEEGVSATGLFRIRGRLKSVMIDEMCERVITVAQRGDVDVWNWRRGVDETLIFGMPAYDTEMYGEPSACTLVRGERLWIGTTTGHIVVFQLLLPHTPTTMSLANINNNNNNNKMEKDGKAPRCVWQAHRNKSAVRSLLVMSLGRHMWSYGEDQQALVWDAIELTLQGSFQFPGNGLITLCGGERYANTTLWGVNANTGTATWFVVKEPLLCDERSSLLRRDECIVKRQEAERFYVLDMLVSHLCSMLQLDQDDEDKIEEDVEDDYNHNNKDEGMKDMKTKSEQRRRKDSQNGEDGVGRVRHNNNNKLSTPPHLDVALQQLQNDQPTMRLLPPAIASLIVGQRMLQRSLIEDGLYSMSFLEDLRQLLQLRRQHRELESQVQRCLNGLNELLPPSELCESIEDVVETIRTFIQTGITSTSTITSPLKMSVDPQQLHQLNSHRRSKSLEDTPPPPPLILSHLNHTNNESTIPGTDSTIATTTNNTNNTNNTVVMRGSVLLPDTIETHHARIRQLEEELLAERRRRQELEIQYNTVEDERHEMQQQLTRAHRLQEEFESRTMALERALKVAKRAAAIPAAGATRLCELESSLLEANRTVKELQSKVETLTRGREEIMQEHASLQTRLQRFKVKEQLAKRAFANFIETQNHVLDRLEYILQPQQQTTSKDRTYNDSDRNNSETTSTDVETLYDWLCARIEQQRETHAGLRHSYMQQSEGEGKEWERVSTSSTIVAAAASVSCVK